MPDRPARLRLKLPSGIEVEAEGASDFVRQQIHELLDLAERPPTPPEAPAEPAAEALEAVLEQTGPDLQIRALPGAEKDAAGACLILMMGSERLLGQGRPTAAQLAKWLRTSGYSVKRMDRSLGKVIRAGQILASGSRRSRRYELSAKGRVAALLAAERLAKSLGGAPSAHTK